MTEIKGQYPFSEEDLKFLEDHPGRVYEELDPDSHEVQIEQPSTEKVPAGDYDAIKK